MTAELGKCRSCGAAVIWCAIAASGKNMPVDAAPNAERGNVRFTDSAQWSAEVLAGDRLATARAGAEELFVSHFATCPNADQHRRASRKQGAGPGKR